MAELHDPELDSIARDHPVLIASGAELDSIGETVNVGRAIGEPDNAYRGRICVKITEEAALQHFENKMRALQIEEQEHRTAAAKAKRERHELILKLTQNQAETMGIPKLTFGGGGS